MNKFIFATLFLLSAFSMNAQDAKQLHIGVGVAFGTHQNQVFSQSSLSGAGFGLQIGKTKHSGNYYRWLLDVPVQTSYKIAGIETTKSTIIDPSLSITWMKGMKKIGSKHLYVGGAFEGSVLFRSSSALGNNGTSLLYNFTFAVASRIEMPVGNNGWQFGGELSLGLLSWAKASDGYAFSAPQDFLTEGSFNYDDESVSTNPFKYGEIAPVGKFNRIKTTISLTKEGEKKNWGFIYDWNLKAYEPFANGQLVQGTHGLKVFVGFKLGRKKVKS